MLKRISTKGKIRFYYKIRSYSYASFNWIHNDFYPNGIKVVPLNISQYLTPLALAIWIMDDGTKHSSGLRLCTNSFTKEDVLFLGQILLDKYGLYTSIHRMRPDKEQYTLYIKKKSLLDLITIVSPYIHDSMKYK